MIVYDAVSQGSAEVQYVYDEPVRVVKIGECYWTCWNFDEDDPYGPLNVDTDDPSAVDRGAINCYEEDSAILFARSLIDLYNTRFPANSSFESLIGDGVADLIDELTPEVAIVRYGTIYYVAWGRGEDHAPLDASPADEGDETLGSKGFRNLNDARRYAEEQS